ncbi:MAG: hypothetical protein MRZ28_08475 [Oscillospiraceae bacterium]|nr:hypothetical protein [Oscillospiraceae bacterium]MCI6027325.1 hypothetical protein [Oscillospiraceae bacterium]MDY3218822.1 hypothetical protein [Candidatus Fimivivens sp.]
MYWLNAESKQCNGKNNDAKNYNAIGNNPADIRAFHYTRSNPNNQAEVYYGLEGVENLKTVKSK